jgi:hypothetical protein
MDARISDPRLVARVEFILKRKVDIATQEHHRAKVELWHLCSAPNSTQPQELRESERRQAIAREALELALKRFNDFILRGTIPDELRNSGERRVNLGISSFA